MTDGIIQKVLEDNKILNINGEHIGYRLKIKQELIEEIKKELGQHEYCGYECNTNATIRLLLGDNEE